ncbi:Hypothetical predicted protein [Paramuricea clavata]|uniref:Uncharacterized protein n=1 Tax=Paramuricea clavata TaxID=317549 RepID=A0A7D9E6Y2_PARCT|nr:Hypothetical predicted protein [Paramuricea clavata]
MGLSMHFCMHSLRQIRHAVPGVVPKYCTARIQFLSHVERCRKLSAAASSQTAVEKPYNDTKGVERVEVLLIKNLLAVDKLEQGKDLVTKATSSNIAVVEKQPCMLENRHCKYKFVSQDILLGPRHAAKQGEILKEHSNLIGITHEIWYCTKIDDMCPKTPLKGGIVEFSVMDGVQCSKMKDMSVFERATRSGPSSEQLSLVLLRLREEEMDLMSITDRFIGDRISAKKQRLKKE